MMGDLSIIGTKHSPNPTPDGRELDKDTEGKKKMQRDKYRKHRHVCQACGSHGPTHIHHIFEGGYRKISERENFVIELCPCCHNKAHMDKDFGDALKRDCEMEYLEDHSMQDWMELMHRNWILGGEVYRTHIITEHTEDMPYTADDFDDFEVEREVI